jgi:hypothetical protein
MRVGSTSNTKSIKTKDSHTTMYHDTVIVLEHSVRYRKSKYYSLVTLSESSYLYIDFAICLQYAYKLAILLFRFILAFNISVFINWVWYINIVTVNGRKYVMVVMQLSVSIDCPFLIATFSLLSYPFPLILMQKLVISIKCVLKENNSWRIYVHP